MKKFGVMVFLIFLLLITVSCSSKPDPLVGSWKSDNGIIELSFVFNAGGTYSTETLGVSIPGKWSRSKDIITLSAKNEAGQIETAKWTAAIEGKKLVMTPVGSQDGLILEKQE